MKRVLGVRGASMLSRILLTVGLFWGALGFVIWVSRVSISGNFLGIEVLRSLTYYVIGPALFFIFASIISAINDVRSGI